MTASSTPLPRVFLSYACSDDRQAPFLAELHAGLQARGFVTWWDRVDMPSRGRTFLPEIRDAIDAHDRIVLVFGPGAATSDYVRAEWQYALAAGKIVNPVLRIGSRKLRPEELLPAELRNLRCPDARNKRRRRSAVEELIRLLRDPVPPLGSLFGPIPESPPHFQPRLDDVSALAGLALLDIRSPVQVPAAERVTVVHGLPGAGKSVLAAAFGRSIESRRVFADGIIWVPVGAAPSVERVVSLACEAAEGVGARARARSDAASRVREAFATKKCLLLLDDVWSLDPVQPFLDAVGPASRIVITTRIADLQSSLGALGLCVGALEPSAALRQLADWSGTSVESLPREAREVARECGCLPLTLALCGALAQDGMSWGDLLSSLQTADLRALRKRLRNYPHTTLLRAMSVSVRQLAREGSDAPRRFRELSVFPAGAPIPVDAVATLWRQTGGLDEKRARRLLVLLQGKSLLRLAGLAHDAVALHDLIWDYLSASVPKGRALHKTLVAAYDARYPAGFHAAPPGDYIVEHAGLHLSEGGLHDRLYGLLDRSWFERKFAVEALRRSFLDDVDRVIRCSLRSASGQLPLLARASLIRASVATLAVSVPRGALQVLARCGHAADALDAARLADNPLSQAMLCSDVAGGLRARGANDEARALILQVLERASTDPKQRANLLAWAAELLAELADAEAGPVIDRAWKTCVADAPTYDTTHAMTRTAVAAYRLGRRGEAQRMLRTAERIVCARPADSRDDSLGAVVEGWLDAGQARSAVKLVAARLRAMRRDRTTRSWSPELELLGTAALACACRGLDAETERLWSQAVRRYGRRQKAEVARYGALLEARRGRSAGAARWLRRAASARGREGPFGEHVELLAGVAIELAAAGRQREALRIVRHVVRLLPADDDHPVQTIADRERVRRIPEVLAALAEARAACGDESGATSLARQALVRATTFRWDSRSFGAMQGGVAAAFAAQGHGARAREIAAAIADDYAQEEAWAKVVRGFVVAGHSEDAAKAAARIADEWRRGKAIADALPAVRGPAGVAVARRLLGGVIDPARRGELLCVLARTFPHAFLDQALSAYPQVVGGERWFAAAESLVVLLHGRRDLVEMARVEDELWKHLPEPDNSTRMEAVQSLARILVVRGVRTRLRALVRVADIKDVEYGACALSRIAWVLAEAGWSIEARAVARRAAARAARIGAGRPWGTADAYARLAHVMVQVGVPHSAVTYARQALASLVGVSGWTSAYDEPTVVRRAVGALLGRILDPQAALETIFDANPTAPTSTGYVADAVLGLYDQVRGQAGRSGARRLEAQIAASRAGCSAWLSVRMAVLSKEDFAHARALLIDALQRASAGSPDHVFDVIGHGAGIVAELDGCRTLDRLYRALAEVLDWRPGSSRLRPAGTTPTLVQSLR